MYIYDISYPIPNMKPFVCIKICVCGKKKEIAYLEGGSYCENLVIR